MTDTGARLGLYCERCAAPNLIGVELEGVYDGVLYWLCQACGTASQRWLPEDRFYGEAQAYIDAVNARGGVR